MREAGCCTVMLVCADLSQTNMSSAYCAGALVANKLPRFSCGRQEWSIPRRFSTFVSQLTSFCVIAVPSGYGVPPE